MAQESEIITPLKAIARLEHWCAYQERSQHEVRQKLRDWQINEEEAEGIIARLISDNFINEARFASALVRGKFRIKKWGRIKIRIALKQHRITERCIKAAMEEIDPELYMDTLRLVLKKKSGLLKEPNKIRRNFKLLRFAMSRGFEQDLIMDVLNEMDKD